MKIIFMGTPEIATHCLNRLLESHHQISAVVTQPDKPSGRGQKISLSPVKKLAISKNIPVFTPEKLMKEKFYEVLKPFEPDVIVVIAYGKILPPEILNIPRLGCINIHLSLLPKYCGAAPIQWALLNNEKKTGVTIMKMNEGLDTGDILMAEELDILDDDDAISLSYALILIGADLLLKVLESAEKTNKLVGTSQDHSLVSYAPQIKKEQGKIKWIEKSIAIKNKVRALIPWPTAYSSLNDKLLKILKVDIFMNDDEIDLRGKEEPKSGTISGMLKNYGPIVKTGDGYVIILKAQPENKKVLNGTDLINGGYVKVGSEFD